MTDDSPVPAVPTRFRIVAPGMRTLAVVLWVVAIVLIPLAVLTQGPRALPFAVAPSVFIAVFGWVVLWRPHVSATADALVVVDVRRTSTIAWRRVTEVRSRYGLEIVTSEGVRRVWIAPRSSARLRLDPVPESRAGSGGTPSRVRTGGAVPVTVAAAAERLVACVPVASVPDGLPPAQVVAAPIVQRIHWAAVLALIVLGVLGSLSGARI